MAERFDESGGRELGVSAQRRALDSDGSDGDGGLCKELMGCCSSLTWCG